MSIIQFSCPCGVTHDFIFPMSKVTDNLTHECPGCGKRAKRVLFSKTADPKFYGDGFYKPSRKD